MAQSIKGKVIDLESGKALSGATIRIENSAIGAITDKKGYYLIKKSVSGNIVLIASIIGYKQEEKRVSLNNYDSVSIDFSLTPKALRTDEIVVTAGKRVQNVQEVPISLSVINSELLSERNITSLEETLVYVPGMNLNGDQVSIRGSSGFAFGIGSRVALLLDGFPLLSGDIGDIKFDAIPLADIERIEIIKGAGSALYGTNALGGVINIITKEPELDANLRLRAYSGLFTKPRFEQWEYSESPHTHSGLEMNFSKSFGDISLSSSGSYINNYGHHRYLNSYKFNLFTKLAAKLSDKSFSNLTASFSSEDRSDWVYWNSLDSATLPPTATDYNMRVRSDKLTLFANSTFIFDKDHFLMVRAGLFGTFFKNTLNPDDAEYRQSDAYSFNSELQFNSNFGNELLSTIGINYLYSDINSFTYGNNSQFIISAYGQLEYKSIPGLIVNAGARFDYEQTSGSSEHFESSPKLGLKYLISKESRIFASIGRGFRAASIAERYASVDFQGFTVIPNPFLKSEYSWSYEIGGEYEADITNMSFNLKFALFQNDLFDLIEPGFTDNSFQTIIFKNLTRARIRGLELSMQSILFALLPFEAGLTMMEPIDLSKNEVLKYRPKFVINLGSGFIINSFKFKFDYRFSSMIEKVDEELKFQVKDYDARVPVHVLDARIIYDMSDLLGFKSEISLIAKNLLDYYYIEMVGNLAPTRFIGMQTVLSF